MKIIFKHIIRNIRANKCRSVLTVFSVAVAAALLLIAMSISSVMSGEYEKILRNDAGKSDILVRTEPERRGEFFEYTENTGVIAEITMLAFFKSGEQSAEWFELRALGYEDLQSCYTINAGELQTLQGDEIIISESTAAELSLKTGDVIPLTLGGKTHDFKIVATAKSEGLFADETRFYTCVVPLETAQSVLECEGRANRLNIFAKECEIESAIAELKLIYPGLIVEETVSRRDVESQTGSFSLIFFLMFFASCAMCIFIVYTSFKALLAERISVLGTFRSVGASRRKSDLIIMLEVLVYGALGGLAAIAGGTVCLLVIADTLGTGGAQLTVPASCIVTSFVFALTLSLLCALPPILPAGRIPLKEIVLGTHKNTVKGGKFSAIAGAVLMTAGLLILRAEAYNMTAVIAATALLFCGIIMLTPLAGSVIAKILETAAPNCLALKNLRKTKHSIISLITIGMTVLLLINNASRVLFSATDEAYNLLNYQIEAIGTPTTRELSDKISSIEGMESTGGIFVKTEVNVEGHIPLMTVYGMEEWKFSEFYNYTTDDYAAFSELKQGRHIMVSKDYMLRSNLKKGDKITLALSETEFAEYTITGVINEMQNSGNVAFISEPNFKSDFKKEFYSFIAVKTSKSTDRAIAEIQAELWDTQINLTALSSIKQAVVDSGATIFKIINLLVLLSSIIGVIGIVNNLVVHFLVRRRTLAMLRAIGLSGHGGGRMIAFEACITGVIGAVLGFAGGTCISLAIPSILRIFEFPAKRVPFRAEQFVICLLCGSVICVIAAAGSVRKVKKLNIISAIKYE